MLKRASKFSGLVLLCLICGIALSPPVASQSVSVPQLLDRYLSGDFDAAVASAAALRSLDPIVDGLERSSDTWIAQAPPTERSRRELAAVTFAIEVARTGVWRSWKIRQHRPMMGMPDSPNFYQPPDVIIWAAPPRLIEWGCARWRRNETDQPSAAERWWHLGAMAVAERAEDPTFLLGHNDGRVEERYEIRHLVHAVARFPTEPRFQLVKAVALEWQTWPQLSRESSSVWNRQPAVVELERLLTDEALGAEARVRLGALLVRSDQLDRALKLLFEAEDLTRDKYLVYLSRYFRGKAYERGGRPADAIAAYRGAVATLPGGQAASLSLATLLAGVERRDEAAQLATKTLTGGVFDPWRGYADADDRFWPEIIARLRKEIRP